MQRRGGHDEAGDEFSARCRFFRHGVIKARALR
jgi:hypothetical protein